MKHLLILTAILLASCGAKTYVTNEKLVDEPFKLETKRDNQAYRIQKAYHRNDILIPLRYGNKLELTKEHIEARRKIFFWEFGFIPNRYSTQIEDQL